MANWRDFCNRVKYSKNDKRFYSSRDMAEAKRQEAISNSLAKRKLKAKKHIHVTTCTCGREGCFYFS